MFQNPARSLFIRSLCPWGSNPPSFISPIGFFLGLAEMLDVKIFDPSSEFFGAEEARIRCKMDQNPRKTTPFLPIHPKIPGKTGLFIDILFSQELDVA